MLRRAFLVLVFGLIGLFPLRGQADGIDDLAAALDLPRLFAILAVEGRMFGDELAAGMFAGGGGPQWAAAVAAIHDPARMQELALHELRAELADQPAAVARLHRYFTAPLGARVATLELAAREAFLDDDLRQAAEQARDRLVRQGGSRLELLERMIVVDDLIEQNVAGTLNSNLAFSQGLLAGSGLDDGELLASLWEQEAQIRAETSEWLLAYLGLAYDPLSDDELRDYIDFSASADGQLLNRALFASFGAVFNVLARELGQAAARHGQGHEL